MNIEINTTYTTREVLDIFGLKERTYYRRQEEFHEYLELYFNYTTWKDGNRRYYKFIEQYKEDIPPFKHKLKSAINEEIYTQVIDSEIRRNPYFTAESLALDKHNNGVFPEGHTVRTSRAYIEKILNNGKYVELDPVWCRRVWNNDYEQAEYIPLTKEEETELKEFMYSLLGDDVFDSGFDYHTGAISKEEYLHKIKEGKRGYEEAKTQYFIQHGFMPFSVRPIGIRA